MFRLVVLVKTVELNITGKRFNVEFEILLVKKILIVDI